MNELERTIKQYKLDELLLLLAKQSREMYLSSNYKNKLEYKRLLGGVSQKVTQELFAWDLADLSNLAIKHSSDLMVVSPAENDVYNLNMILVDATNDEAKRKLKENRQEDILTHILLGLSQKQFWYQDMAMNSGRNDYYNFLRYYVLLYEMPKFFPETKSPNDDLVEITGFDIKSFSQLLLVGWSHNKSKSPVIGMKVTTDLTRKIPVITEPNMRKCLDFFTADYNFYRQSDFPNNPLFLRPIVRTSTNKLIVQDTFMWARKFYEGIYWIIRNKYCENDSRDFTSNFGEYYERYVEELLGYYLDIDSFEKVRKDKNEKRADWLVHTEKYILVIEQKSCLMQIALKKEYPSILALDKYLGEFKKAFLQIAGTIETVGKTKKQIIKLVLHFETFYVGEAIIKERVTLLCKDEVNDLSNYFLIDTEGFEALIQILAEDEECFDKIINTKIDYENNAPTSAGREFNFIINKHTKVKDNKFLESYSHFHEELYENLR